MNQDWEDRGENPYAKGFAHCLKHSYVDYTPHNSATCRRLTPEEVQRQFGLHLLTTETMPKNANALPSSPLDSSALNKKIDDIIQCFEAAMKTQAEEFQLALQKTANETSIALQLLKEFTLMLISTPTNKWIRWQVTFSKLRNKSLL